MSPIVLKKLQVISQAREKASEYLRKNRAPVASNIILIKRTQATYTV
jgi:hypothetical protein